MRRKDQGRQRLRVFQDPGVPGRVSLRVYSEAECHSLHRIKLRRTLRPSEHGDSPMRGQQLQQHLHALLKEFPEHEVANKAPEGDACLSSLNKRSLKEPVLRFYDFSDV